VTTASVNTVIPKRIIQTAKTRQLTLKQRALSANVRLLHPEYEWQFFDDADVTRFITHEFPQYQAVFDGFPFPIQRYDFFRYLAVYRFGGFYFDLDVVLAEAIDSLRSTGCVFPFEGLTFSRLLRERGMDWEVGNYAFGATAGHPFLRAVIENCVRAFQDRNLVRSMMAGVPLLSRREHHVLYSTGPGLLSRTLVEHPDLARHVTVLFPDDVCESQNWNAFGTFGVHLMEGTWRLPSSRVRRRLTQILEARATLRRLRESERLGRSRSVISAPVSLSGTSRT